MNQSRRRFSLSERLLRHHLPMLGVCAVSSAAIAGLIQSDHAPYRWSMATAYVALALLAATLATGPINLLRRQPNPVSTDLRRDLGLWAFVLGLAHTVIGLQVHMKSMWLYFFREITGPQAWSLRNDQFGLANYTGLVAALLLVLLVALSNDFSLRRLGAPRWKWLQRWNYALFALVLVHGILYQLIEKRSWPWPVWFGALVLVALLLQVAGIVAIGRRSKGGIAASPRAIGGEEQ
jgi:sulfoxide reductase heme-binding subunit YedZ